MTLRSIRVNGLFGYYNHEVTFKKADVVVLIGPNGIGKTTLLKIIDSIFSKDFRFLQTIEFSSIEMLFIRSCLKIWKDRNGVIIVDDGLHRETRIKLTAEPAYRSRDEFFEGLPETSDDHYPAPTIPGWLSTKLSSVKVKFIESQRIFLPKFERDRFKAKHWLEYRIKEISRNIYRQLRIYQNRYYVKSVQLDNEFVPRFFNKLYRHQTFTPEKIEAEMEAYNRERVRMGKIGLMSEAEVPPNIRLANQQEEIEQAVWDIFGAYISDMNTKIQELRELADKLELFLDMINARFRGKQIAIDPEKGLVAIATIGHENEIPLERLSSGEQNELIMFYELLFETEDKEIVLLDEPEISLHIDWQQKLIDDFSEIARMRRLSMVIATHSPDIIGDKWENVHTLG